MALQTAVATLRNPPRAFEDVIRQYYIEGNVLGRLRDRCRAILASPPAEEDAPPVGSAEGILFGPISRGARAMITALLKAMDELAAKAAIPAPSAT